MDEQAEQEQQAEQAAEAQSNEQQNKLAAAKRGLSIKAIFGVVGVLGVALLPYLIVISGAIAVFPFAMKIYREVAPMLGINSNGTITCTSWANAPEGYQELFTKAAHSYGIHPAFLGAIFLSEHSSTWTDGPWASSPKGAKGPFQFMDGTWKSNGVDGNKDGDKNVMDINDAAYAAARYLQAVMSNKVTKNFGTTDEIELKMTACGYNWGEGNDHVESCKKYAEGDTSVSVPKETINYMDRMWGAFTSLNQGCSSSDAVASIGGGEGDKPADFFNQSKRQNEWLSVKNSKGQPVVNGTMRISGIVLHYTAGDSVEGALSGMRKRTDPSFVQLIIDKDGTVYQLLPLNAKVRSGSGDGNTFAIGIEIVGNNESEILKQSAQYNSVIKTVNYLISTYNIPNVRGNESNLRAHRGIFGHFQTQSANGVWTANLKRGCKGTKIDPGVTYVNKVWGDLNSTDIGCTQ